MTGKAILPISAALLAIGCPCAALAQAAAESAVILSGTGQATGSASRSLGSAVSGSINAAAAQIASARSAEPASDGRRRRDMAETQAIPADVDMLEGTDAPTYRLGNGSSIRVSGTLIQGAETACSKNCPADSGRRKASH